MNNQQTVTKWVSETKDTRVIAVPAVFIRAFGHKAAFFVAQCVFWSDKSNKAGKQQNTFYKSTEEWQKELGLSYHDICKAVEASQGVITKKVRKVFGIPTLHWTVNMERLKEIIFAYGGTLEDIPSSENTEDTTIGTLENTTPEIQNSKNLKNPQKFKKFENPINIKNKMTNTRASARASDKPKPVFLGDENDLEITSQPLKKGPPSTTPENVPDLSWLRYEYRPMANRFLKVAGQMYYPANEGERRLWYRELHVWLKMGATPDDVEQTIKTMRSAKLTIGGVQSLTKMLRDALANKTYGYDPLVEAGYTRIS